MHIAILFFFLVVQTKLEPCNKDLSFCWFEASDGSDEVQVSGDVWIAQDKTEKPIEGSLEIRCLRRLKLCAHGHSDTFVGKTFTKVEFLQITKWDMTQITMQREYDPCEINTYMINKLDRTVFLVSAPGDKANTSGCKGILGEPKTVIYKLSHKP